MNNLYANIIDKHCYTSEGIQSFLTLDMVSCSDGCGYHGILQSFVDKLNDLDLLLLNKYGFGLTVTSAVSVCRCKRRNQSAGGSSGSLHMTGEAGDFTAKCSYESLIKNVKIIVVEAPAFFNGVLYYPFSNFVHLDIRQTPLHRTYYKNLDYKNELLLNLI